MIQTDRAEYRPGEITAPDGAGTTSAVFTESVQVDWVQCKNDVDDDGVSDTPMCTWANGDLNANNALITEGNNPPPYPPRIPGHVNYRAIFEGLQAGTYDLTVKYDFTKGGKVAFDFLTTNYGVSDANLCTQLPSGVTASECDDLVSSGASSAVFPLDPETLRAGLEGGAVSDRQTAHSNALAGDNPRTMQVYGATITSITNNARSGSDSGNSNDSATIRFEKSTNETGPLMVTWGGHLGIGAAFPAGYGSGNGAGSISGAPFHMSLDVLARIEPNPDPNVLTGSRDRSVQPGAVILSAILIVIKHVVNDGGGTAVASDFTIHVTEGGLDVAGSPAPGSENGTRYELVAGTYVVSEDTPPEGYAHTFTGDCYPNGTVILAPGESKTCTITNDDITPKLTVIKHVVNDNGGTAVASDFTILVNGTNVAPASFPGADSPGTDVMLDAGAYSVSESGPIGYESSFSPECSGTIGIGESKTCLITNDDRTGRLIVIKHVVNDNGGTAIASDFAITVAGTNPVPGSFPGSESGTTVLLDAGPYNVSESGPSGYRPSFSPDCSGTMAIGETRTCTITNDDITPKLTVIKRVINDNGGTAVASDFTITVDGTNATPVSFPGAEDPGTTVTLDAGSYSVSETGPGGYAATYSKGCSGTIGIGETRSCTIWNDDIPARLIVIKHVVNSANRTAVASDFTIHVTGNNPSPATFPGAESPGTNVTLDAGAYVVTEDVVPGYVGSFSPGCSGTIGVGETRTCTVTNGALPLSALTDSGLCYFDIDPTIPGQQFRLIFTSDRRDPVYKLTASNPGQFYYNLFYVGTPGGTLELDVTFPYPFVTQGAVPIQVHSEVSIVNGCYLPSGEDATRNFTMSGTSTRTPSGALGVGLSDYGSSPEPGATTVTVHLSGTIPSSGLAYVTIHMDYGLKQTDGYAKGPNDEAIGNVTIYNLGTYTFSFSGTGGVSDAVSVNNLNDFKHVPDSIGLPRDWIAGPATEVRREV